MRGLLGSTLCGSVEHGLCPLRVSSAQLTEVSQVSAEQDSRGGLEAPHTQEVCLAPCRIQIVSLSALAVDSSYTCSQSGKCHKEQTPCLLASAYTIKCKV